MDKETLSHYGWIVVLILILSVMMALATPFGKFITTSVQNTTEALFDTKSNALEAAGVEKMELEFENAFNESFKECPIKYGEPYGIEIQEDYYYIYKFYVDGSIEMSVVYDGQLLGSDSAPAGAVGYDGLNLTDSSSGEIVVVATISADGKQIDMGDGMILILGVKPCLHENLTITNTGTHEDTATCQDCGWSYKVVPENATYYVGVTSAILGDYTGATAIFTEGQTMPSTVNDGDVYVFGDYEYRYNQYYGNSKWISNIQNGWGVRVIDDTKSTCGAILESINCKPITSLYKTFYYCESLVTAPVIPSSVTNMQNTFYGCTSLTTAPVIPSSVTNMWATFLYCESLVTAPVIPDNVTNMRYTFEGCTSLVTAPVIPSSVTDMSFTFEDCTSLITPPDMSYATSVTNMEYTFEGCTSLVNAPTILNSVTNMTSTFSGCTSLITPPDMSNATSVTNMRNTFAGCTSLTSKPTIPSSVTTAESSIFAGCTQFGY
ncbi:MAG: leucine-rich repeat protein [Clostridia bacterium]|nr:leucine-rich repeat protein [Clostridia bacterium]